MSDATKLHAFLAHSNQDKPLVHEVYHLMRIDGFEPWLDVESLVAGRHWELEIERAVAGSHVIVLFISPSGIDRAGYLHKEIAMALDVAERQPEGAIYIIPVLLGECDMPSRLKHLHWLRMPHDPEMAAEIYSLLQTSLLTRASELGLVTKEQLDAMPRERELPLGVKGVRRGGRPLQKGVYLVRGRNPDGSLYYGTARVIRAGLRTYKMDWNIGGETIVYEGGLEILYEDRDGVSSSAPYVVLRQGEHRIAYKGQSRTGIYEGDWGVGGTEELVPVGGTEQLIPASPFVRLQPRGVYLRGSKTSVRKS
jgi:hypothetical protein